MYRNDGSRVVSASDLIGFLECQHLTRLSLEVARGQRGRPAATDPMTELVARLGMDHEARHVRRLRERGLSVVAIDSPAGVHTPGELRLADGLCHLVETAVEGALAGAS